MLLIYVHFLFRRWLRTLHVRFRRRVAATLAAYYTALLACEQLYQLFIGELELLTRCSLMLTVALSVLLWANVVWYLQRARPPTLAKYAN